MLSDNLLAVYQFDYIEVLLHDPGVLFSINLWVLYIFKSSSKSNFGISVTEIIDKDKEQHRPKF